MKLPRDLSGEGLAKALKRFDYILDRQTGSHKYLDKINCIFVVASGTE